MHPDGLMTLPCNAAETSTTRNNAVHAQREANLPIQGPPRTGWALPFYYPLQPGTGSFEPGPVP